MTPARRIAPAEVPGLAARRIAADILDNVLRRNRPLDGELDGAEAHPGLAALADRDRALVRKLAATVLRRIGTLRHLLRQFLDSGFPEGCAARRDRAADRRGADPVPRRARPCGGRSQRAAGAGGPPRREISRPDQRGAAPGDARGAGAARRRSIRCRSTRRPGCSSAGSATTARRPRARSRSRTATSRRSISPSRPTPKAGRSACAAACCRRAACAPSPQGQVSLLPGYHEGAWWVQDAAAALPARLLGDVAGKRVADLCAAPGGKTAQLAQAGAAGHRGRPLGQPAGAGAREPAAARPRTPT